MEEIKLIVVEKNEVEIVEEIIDNTFGIFGRSRMNSKKKHSN